MGCRRGLALIVICVYGTAVSFAQPLNHQLICEWVGLPIMTKSAGLAVLQAKPLAEDIDLLTFADSASAADALKRLRSDRRVRRVQLNWRVGFRKQPGDPLYGDRGNFARAGFEEAWDLTTGGSTPGGVPIVTVVLDDGFDTGHEDLRESLWINPGEKPLDGIDNDGNGLIDDIHGWDFASGSGTFQPNDHGTKVAGILGAKGDNGTGITGGNWKSQLMLFTTLTVADIVAAYGYAIEQRKLFDVTNGKRGAFIVATNASFGISGATCADFPVWGGMYDKLGRVGILTAASTSNSSRDVDLRGDMPADCQSDFLISVTNVDSDDRLEASAAYGATTIDLAAPGEGSLSTRPADRYGGFGGTSAAAPYVSSAISLLAATPCPRLERLYLEAPAAAALQLKKAILNTTRSATSLTSRTVSGGIIDVGAAQALLLRLGCDSDLSTGIYNTKTYPNPASQMVYVDIDQYDPAERAVVYLHSVDGRNLGLLNFTVSTGLITTIRVELPELPGGVYFLHLPMVSGLIISRIVVY